MISDLISMMIVITVIRESTAAQSVCFIESLKFDMI